MKAQIAMAGVGAVGLIIGLALAFGVIPGVAATVTAPGGVAQFSYTTTNLNVTSTDHSVLPTPSHFNGLKIQEELLLSVLWSWGDNSTVLNETSHGLGFALNHSYVRGGVYTVSDSVLYAYCVQPVFPGAMLVCSRTTSVASTQLTVTPGGSHTGGGSQSTVTPNFSYSQTTGGVLTVKDTTTTLNATVTSLVFSWGDGTSSVSALAGTASHTYTANGTYVVTDTVTWYPTGGSTTNTYVATNAYNVTVVVAPTCATGACVGGHTTGTGSSSVFGSFVFDALTGAVILGFGTLLVVAFTPLAPPAKVAAVFVLFLIGLGLGWVFGGL